MKVTCLIYIILHVVQLSNGLSKKKKCQLTKVDSQEGIFKMIGFFPITDEQAEVSVHAVAWSEAMKYEIQKGNDWFNNSDLIGYTLYDTCSSNLDVVTEAMMEVLLSKGPEYLFGCSCIEKNIPLFRTIGIVGPALSTNTRYVNELVLYEKVPVISYASTSPELGDKKKYPYFFRTSPPDTYQARFVNDILLRFNWSYVSILASDDIYGRYGIEYLIEEFHKNKKICTGLTETFSVPIIKQELRSHIQKLKKDTMAKVIILWGYFFSVKIILETAYEFGLEDKTWIISEASGRNSWFTSAQNKLNGTFLIIEADGGHDKKFEKHFLNLKYKDSKKNPWLRSLFERDGNFNTRNKSKTLKDIIDIDDIGSRVGYVQKAVQIFLHAFSAYMRETSVCQIKDSLCEIPSIVDHGSFSRKYVSPATFVDQQNITYYFNIDGTIMDAAFDLLKATKDGKNNFQYVLHWTSTGPIRTVNNSLVETLSNISANCSKPCKPGYHRFYNNLKECCWKCIQCPLDHKTIENNKTNCEKCANNHISNMERTKCLPLKSKYIYYLSNKAYIIYIMSSIGILLTLPIAITFILARNTPVIRSSRLYLSLGQLFIHLVLFLVPALFLGIDSKLKCISRAYSITTSFVLIIALSITKINHIVTVFNLKYRLTKWKRIKLQTVEYIIVFVCLIIKFCLSVILFQFKPVHMIAHIERSTAELSEKCDIMHYEYQVGLIMILEIICGIQAFRGRKLPTNYNEAKYVTFAMFTSTLITATGIPLTLSMPDVNDQNLIIAIVTILSNISILLTLFGYKIVIIWIYPNYNSVEVFQRERMEKVVSETDKRLSTVSCYSITSITERNKAFVLSILEEQERKRKVGLAVEFHKTSFYKREISSKYDNQTDNDSKYAYENEVAIKLSDEEDFSTHESENTSMNSFNYQLENNNDDETVSQNDDNSQADTTYSYDESENLDMQQDHPLHNDDQLLRQNGHLLHNGDQVLRHDHQLLSNNEENHPYSHVNESYCTEGENEESEENTIVDDTELPPIIEDGMSQTDVFFQ